MTQTTVIIDPNEPCVDLFRITVCPEHVIDVAEMKRALTEVLENSFNESDDSDD